MPDLNSVPASPHSLAASRRQSTTLSQMAAPKAPASPSLNILPSNQSAVNPSATSSLPSPQLSATQPALPVLPQPQTSVLEPGVGPGPGPLRHPRPLTAAELHLQLEKEQEAVVNRLTRELSLLRAAQNASVASNASSTSAAHSAQDTVAEPSLLSGAGFSIPTARSHNRTSSTASQGLGAQYSSSYEARIHQPRPMAPVPLSRQNSSASRRSQTNSPGPQHALDPSSYFHNQRIPHPPSLPPLSSVGVTPGSGPSDQLSPGLIPVTSRYEETALHRSELEAAKRENDALKRRIRELERQVRERRASESSRTRSESVSTTASFSITPARGASIAGPRDSGPARPERERGMTTQSMVSIAGSVGVGVPEEEVRVGESAASSVIRTNAQQGSS